MLWENKIMGSVITNAEFSYRKVKKKLELEYKFDRKYIELVEKLGFSTEWFEYLFEINKTQIKHDKISKILRKYWNGKRL